MNTDGTASAIRTSGGSPSGTVWPPDDPIRLHDTLDAAARAIRPDGPDGPEKRRAALQDAYISGSHAFASAGQEAVEAFAVIVSALGHMLPGPPPAEVGVRLMQLRVQQISERLPHHRKDRELAAIVARLRQLICGEGFDPRTADVAALELTLGQLSERLRRHRDDTMIFGAVRSLRDEIGTIADIQGGHTDEAADVRAREVAASAPDPAALHEVFDAAADAIFQAEEGNPRSAPRFLAEARTAAASAFAPRSRQAAALSVILAVVAAAIGGPA
jgi:hypothetical protein